MLSQKLTSYTRIRAKLKREKIVCADANTVRNIVPNGVFTSEDHKNVFLGNRAIHVKQDTAHSIRWGSQHDLNVARIISPSKNTLPCADEWCVTRKHKSLWIVLFPLAGNYVVLKFVTSGNLHRQKTQRACNRDTPDF